MTARQRTRFSTSRPFPGYFFIICIGGMAATGISLWTVQSLVDTHSYQKDNKRFADASGVTSGKDILAIAMWMPKGPGAYQKRRGCGGSSGGAMMAQLVRRVRFQQARAAASMSRVQQQRVQPTVARRAGMIRAYLRQVLLVLISLATAVGGAAAQCPVSNPDDDVPPELPTVQSSTREGEPRIPESGYLSNTSYANVYFGFVMELPLTPDGHRIMMPLMPPGQHALLALGFQEGHRLGTLLITASEPHNPVHAMTEAERNAEFQAWAKGQPQHQITPPDWLTRTGHFYHIAKHSGSTTTVQYWTFIKNYLIRVKVASNDAAFLRKTKEAVAGVKFYCAREDGSVIDEQGKFVPTPGEGYLGPTIPTSVVDAALDDKPALETIEGGEASAGIYRNEEIGLTYRYPTTWEIVKGPADPPAKDEAEQRTRDVLDACSLMLLRLAPSSASGRMITLRAIDQTCLGLPAPASFTDQLGAEELGAYLQILGAFGELRSTNLALHTEHLFAEYSGLLGEHAEGQPLAKRRVEAVAVTRHRKLLLVWTWIAPSMAELGNMPKTSVSFEDGPPIELVPATIIAKR